MGENGSQSQVSDHQQNIELMRAMGARSYDPIPPDQYLYHLDDPCPLHRLLAWMLSKTIRKGHRSRYAVDQNGRKLGLSHLAADCFHGNLGNASATWKDAEERKLVAKDDEGRLCLCGKVLPRDSLKKQQDGSEEVLRTENLVLRTENLRQRFENLPVEDQDRFRQAAREFDHWAHMIHADAAAAVRALIEEHEKRLLADYGMERRENGRNKRNLSENPLCLQLQLFSVPEFSGSKNGHSVRTEESIPYEPENGSVRNPLNKEAEYRENLIQREPPSNPALSSSSKSSITEDPPQPPQQSKNTTTTTEKEQTPPKYSTERDRTIAIILKFTGRSPDRKLIRQITEMVEVRGGSPGALKGYNDDMEERCPRLSEKAGFGFFYQQAKAWAGFESGSAQAQEAARKASECACRGSGRIADGYCTCPMGADLRRVERRKAKEQPSAEAP